MIEAKYPIWQTLWNDVQCYNVLNIAWERREQLEWKERRNGLEKGGVKSM